MKQVINEIMDHPDKDEILVKLISDCPVKDIAKWLASKYKGQSQLTIPVKSLQTFKNEYLDLYTKVREDLMHTHFNMQTVDEEMQIEINGNPAYQKKLAEIAEKEMDIKSMIRKMVVMIEHRTDQMYTLVQEDIRNFKMDKQLIEWLNLLLTTLEKFDLISNGSPEQVTINNNFNIQMVDTHINTMHQIIREVLSQIDNESSLLFTELFTQRMQELRESNDKPEISQEKRLEATYTMSDRLDKKLQP